MELVDVRAYALSSPIDPPQERHFHGGRRTLYKRDAVVVVVETRDGERGVAPAGASSSAMREFFEEDSQASFARTIEGPVADALEGEPFDDIEAAVAAVDAVDLPELVSSQAAGSIDVALHDVMGKRQGVPVYELLADATGADPTTRHPLYASAGMYMEPDGYAEQARLLDDVGFHGYKYRPGIGPDGDVRTVEAIASATEDIEIMVDAHTWWKLEDPYPAAERERVIDAYEAADVYWLEEPVAPDDYAGYRDLADATSVPLAGGESEESPAGLIDLLDTGAVDFLQGDVRHHRGFTGCLRAAAAAREADTQFVPHHFGTRLGLIANAHLVAALPDAHLLEYPVFEGDPTIDHPDGDPGMYPFDLAFDVLNEGIDVADGELAVPDDPGLGVTVNEDVFEEYAFREGAWTEFEYDD